MARKISIEAARVTANLTQAELAQKLGVSRETVSLWENGKLKMKPAYLLAICHITGFDPEDIFLPERFTCSEEEE